MPVITKPIRNLETSTLVDSHNREKTGVENMDTAESAVFLPRFTYRRTYNRRYISS